MPGPLHGEFVVVIAGPTGVGKSRIASTLARRVGGEIVNYDSVQIYRGFDIGSAKPPVAERSMVPHHLFDIVEGDEHFDVASWARAAEVICRDIWTRGRIPLLVGGTGFYLRAFLSGLPELPPRNEKVRARLKRILATARGPRRLHRLLSRVDPVSASRIAPADRHRLERALEVFLTTGSPISSWQPPAAGTPGRVAAHKFALTLPREDLVARLDARVDAMYAAGLVEETRGLLARLGPGARPLTTIGYREAVNVLTGVVSLDQAIAETKRRTRAYAKRQMTWLRAERNVHWLDIREGDEAVIESIERTLREESR